MPLLPQGAASAARTLSFTHVSDKHSGPLTPPWCLHPCPGSYPALRCAQPASRAAGTGQNRDLGVWLRRPPLPPPGAALLAPAFHPLAMEGAGGGCDCYQVPSWLAVPSGALCSHHLPMAYACLVWPAALHALAPSASLAHASVKRHPAPRSPGRRRRRVGRILNTAIYTFEDGFDQQLRSVLGPMYPVALLPTLAAGAHAAIQARRRPPCCRAAEHLHCYNDAVLLATLLPIPPLPAFSLPCCIPCHALRTCLPAGAVRCVLRGAAGGRHRLGCLLVRRPIPHSDERAEPAAAGGRV